MCFSERILSGEEGAQEAYLTFLRSGGSDFPIEILKKSGLDMTSSAPMLKAFSYIERKLEELASLL
ncbi:oligoendopeptidase F [Chlamydia trachomatis]|nr:oligoendopeptidase F [Chlamydia trachomatis]CRH48997.1 oligoendopeptidase F [Chlamydia trachomatis]